MNCRSIVPRAPRDTDGTGGSSNLNSLYVRAEAMEDEEGRARGGAERQADRLRREGNGAGAAGDPQEASGHGTGVGEGLHALHGGRAERDVRQEEAQDTGESQPRVSHTDAAIRGRRAWQGGDHLRPLQREDLRRDPDGLPAVGSGRGGQERASDCSSGEVCDVGQALDGSGGTRGGGDRPRDDSGGGTPKSTMEFKPMIRKKYNAYYDCEEGGSPATSNSDGRGCKQIRWTRSQMRRPARRSWSWRRNWLC